MTRQQVWTLLGVLLVLIAPILGQSKGKVKPISTHLNAKWPHTPLLLEISEYLAEEGSATFWSFVEAINQLDLNEYAAKTEKDKFDIAISTAGMFLTEEQLKLLKFSIGLRVYSPKLEMFRQIAADQGVIKKGCQTAVEVGGQIICDINDLEKSIQSTSDQTTTLYDVDHIFPNGKTSKASAILYGELGTAGFRDFHETLKNAASSNKLKYIIRPYVQNPGNKKVRLSGYGVELQIKSTEYKNQDDTKIHEDSDQVGAESEEMREIEGFMFSKLRSLYPEKVKDLKSLSDHLLESTHELAPMKVWQLQHLSMQAAQSLMSLPNEEMLSAFSQIASNFPMLARSLTRTKVGDKLKREIVKNQNTLRSEVDVNPSDAALFINGMQFDLDYTDIYTLLDHIRDEQKVMEGLHRLGLKGDTLTNLLQLDLVGEKLEYGIDIRDSAIAWLNNIETDKAYKRWPQSTGELLRPAFPGSLRSIRKNFHNLVLIVDPTERSSVDMLRLAEAFLVHVSPVRFGLVLSVNSDKKLTGFDDAGVAMLCAFNFVSQNEEGESANLKAMQLITELHNSLTGTPTASDVTSFFKLKYKNEDLEDVFAADSDYDVGRQLSKIFVEKGGFQKFPQALMNGIPLPEKALSGDEFEESILMEVMKNTQKFRKAVLTGELDDAKDVMDWLMAQPNIMPRLNERILSSKDSYFVDLSHTTDSSASLLSNFESFEKLHSSEMTSAIANGCRYLTTKAEFALRPLTVWVAADYETAAGRDVLLNAVKFTRESNGIRICGLHNTQTIGRISRVIQVAQSSLAAPIARQFLVKTLENARQIEQGTKTIHDFAVKGMDMDAFESRLNVLKDDVFKSHSLYISKVLSIAPGSSTVVANGRVLGSLNQNETFTDEDFALLENNFLASIGDKVLKLVSDHPQATLSDLMMRTTGVLQSKVHTKPRVAVALKAEQFSVIKLNPRDTSKPAFDLIAVCDPVSAAAQKIGPLLQTLHKVLNANVKIILNSVEKHSEMPLKSFYRYVLQAEPQFTESGDLSTGPQAHFTGLPESTIFTQSFHVPENWLVEVVKSLYDLDNIKLANVESGVQSEFELEHLLLEGHCFEHATGNPPRGLQFTLGNLQNTFMVDTIVMANLGYFQLKANPGAMVLRLREGRSADIYTIVSHEGAEPIEQGQTDVHVVVSSFRSHVVKVKVSKKPAMMDKDLMEDDDDEATGIWGSITSTFSTKDNDKQADDTINIFSVASGHLYERFLRIMTVSVRKHTNAKVKFWFIKNFLSPDLKDSLPILAKEFDFEYELVQYKWPRWLHQQTEKQRIIWGYKILFLDVLFPLHVTKIIFVDADQVVRDDIQKLYDLDLEGAPYGFVPFCDSRKEMEGFRFWKQGYWRNHLAGRKYHISALFVVDLKKFRRIAAGDRLRGQYQGLSQDPNSLSNLDQDLPNNMIHQVRIKSLPMEWLWCETWCDNSSKSTAKVIDVCNNPLTKEAKLDAANRIIGEWSEYDNTIKRILHKNTKPTLDHKPVHVEL